MRVNRKGTNGTGRDIPTVYVPSRPAVPPFAARDKGDIAGHCPVCPVVPYLGLAAGAEVAVAVGLDAALRRLESWSLLRGSVM